MSIAIAYNTKEGTFLICDKRYTVYDLNGKPTGLFTDTGNKIKIKGRYAYTTVGMTIPSEEVDKKIQELEDNISFDKLVNKISTFCKEADSNFRNSPYAIILENGIRTVGLYLACENGHVSFHPDSNFEPQYCFEELYFSNVHANEKVIVAEIIKKIDKLGGNLIETFIETVKEISKLEPEVSPTCDIVLVNNRGVGRIAFKTPLIAGVIRTSEGNKRMELGTGNSLKSYNDSNNLHGLYSSPDDGNGFIDFKLFRNGVEFFTIYDADPQAVQLKHLGSAFIEASGSDVKFFGNVDFTNATVTNLNVVAVFGG